MATQIGIVLAAPSTPVAVQIAAQQIAEKKHGLSFVLFADAYAAAIPYCNGWDGWIQWCLKRYEVYASAELFVGKINQEIIRRALATGRRVTFGEQFVTGITTLDSRNWKRGWRLLLDRAVAEKKHDYEELL